MITREKYIEICISLKNQNIKSIEEFITKLTSEIKIKCDIEYNRCAKMFSVLELNLYTDDDNIICVYTTIKREETEEEISARQQRIEEENKQEYALYLELKEKYDCRLPPVYS